MKLEHQSVSIPFDVDSASSGTVCRWDAPGGAQRITLSAALVRELRQAAIQAFLAIPRRGVEIGGLLFGQVRQEPPTTGPSETTVFEISAFEDVPCEHRFGPSYILDDTDRDHLAELLSRYQEEGAPSVVGFYRSYTGREAQMDEDDQRFIQTFFPHRPFACLLLQPLSMEKCAAGFQFWSDSDIRPEPAYAPFPFEAKNMRLERVELPAAPEPPAAPELYVPPDTPEPAVAETREMEPLEIPVETRLPAPVVRMRESYSRGLGHRRYADEDTEETARGASHPSRILWPLLVGMLLVIASGALYELWKVTREPRWVPVRFDARPSAQQLLLSWDASAPTVAQATRGVLAVGDGANPVEIQLSPDQLRHGSFSYSPSNPDVLFRLRFYDKDREVVSDSLRVLRLPNPPPIVVGTPVTSPPVTSPPVVSSPATPEEPVAANSPVVRHEVLPVISPGIRRRISRLTVVPVFVHVDESGRVTKASSKVTGHGLDRYLADEAVKAARQWSFSPARAKNGSPVSGTKTISFEFTPGQ